MKKIKIVVIQLLLMACVIQVRPQYNTDLPSPTPHDTTLPAGSLIIAMDNTYQGTGGKFNLKAYGLVVHLLNRRFHMYWVIKAGKLKDSADFKVMAEKAYPTPVSTTTEKVFKAGPFVIFPDDTLGIAKKIDSFNKTVSTDVLVYRTKAEATVDIRYDMIGMIPKVAIMDDGGNAQIHEKYMQNASIPVNNYSVLNTAVLLYENCYTLATEPHNDGTKKTYPISQIADSIKQFVQTKGGNFLAECHAIETYENDVKGHFQTGGDAAPYMDAHTNIKIDNNFNFVNADLSYLQMEGDYNPNHGGFTQTYFRFPGITADHSFYPVIVGSTAATDSVFSASVSKHQTGKGGLVFFLGNHNFDGTKLEDINGQRLYFNAMLTPAAYPTCPGFEPLAVNILTFNARRIAGDRVQLSWTTVAEVNSIEYVIQRSTDGINFTEISRVPASGGINTGGINTYNAYDQAPEKGVTNYYRFYEVASDGTKVFSKTLAINMSGKGGVLNIYPVPASGKVTIELTDNNFGHAVIEVYNMAGKKVAGAAVADGINYTMDIQQLLNGYYMVKVILNDGSVLQGKLLIAR